MDGRSGVPRWARVGFTAFMAVLVPVYLWHYGPTNFLYFCDIALVLTLVGVWMRGEWSGWGRGLISMCAVGIVVPQALWLVDFVGHWVGLRVVGMTDYMFDDKLPLFLRGLSLFHGWLPILLVYLVWRVGYDRRAVWWWTGLTWVVLPVCWLLMPAPGEGGPGEPVNINYVFGPSDEKAQTWMPGWVYFGLLMVRLPVLAYLPAHLVLRWVGKKRATGVDSGGFV